MAEKLSVTIDHTTGITSRWGPDSWASKDVPTGVTFGSSIPGGHKDATLTLARRIDQDYEDLNLLDPVTIRGMGGEAVFEGFISALPRTHGDQYSITVNCLGWSSTLKDDPSFREIYVDRD